MKPGLSLRRRLQIGSVCAVVALALAIAALVRVAGESDSARARVAMDTASTIASALRRGDRVDPDAARAAIGSVRDASAGTCGPGEPPALLAGNGARREVVVHPPPPDLLEALRKLCDGPHVRHTLTIEHPRDLAAVVVEPLESAGSVWVIVRVTRPDEAGGALRWPIVVLALGMLAIALNTVAVLRALRTGATQLATGLGALELDLAAAIPRPHAQELGAIADGLQDLAHKLAAARSRERTLETRLAHEQRLSALGRVVAGVAHEVRNPLTGIKLRLDLVTRGATTSPAVLEDVRVALAEVARLDALVTSLLAVAKRSSPPEAIELGDLVDERVALLAPWAAERGVMLQRRGTATVTSARDALARALDNLVRNAVEISPTGCDVVVAIATVPDAVTIDIADRGPGLAPGVELFEPFSTGKPDGTGLGTFIARSLIEGAGGTITYEREDSWTHLRIQLPTS